MSQDGLDQFYYLVIAGCIVSGLWLACLFIEFFSKSKGKR